MNFLRSFQAVWSANNVVSLLQTAGIFLSPMEDEQRKTIGKYFLQLYVRLARKALDDGQRLFRVRPKFHLLLHLLEDKRPSKQNPAHCSCWMDEDYIKKVMRVKKLTHRRTAALRCLQRWLMALPGKLQEAEKKLRL